MALNFPNNPQPGDTYIGDNGVLYTYDGVKWSGAGVEPGLALPTASTTTAGVVKVDGTTITITDGVISANIQGGGGNVSLPGLATSGTGTSNVAGNQVYALAINTESESDDEIALKVYAGGNNAGPAIAIGQDIGGSHRANVVAIGNDDVGYNSLPGGVYIGYQAGWNDTEQPQGLHAIAIGSKAAYTFATNNSITLNATGSELNPTGSGLFVKPIRSNVVNTTNTLYYNAASGEVTYGTHAPVTVGNTAQGIEGSLWYNTEDGRTYVYALDTWIDASPAVVPGNMVGYGQDGNITLNEDARINYANGVSIINSVYGDTEVANFLSAYTGNIAKIGSAPLGITAADIRLSSDNETWRFTSTGNIIFPDGSQQATAYTGGGGGTGNALVNGAYTVALQANGVVTIGANATISNDGEFRLWATDTDITVYRNGQDGYGVKAGNIEVYTDNGLRTLTNSQGFELKTGNIIIPNDKGVVFANGVNILSTVGGGDGTDTVLRANVIQVLSDLTSFGASPAPRIYGFSSIATTGSAVNEGNISASGNLVAGRHAYVTGNVFATNVSVSGNLTVDNTLVNRVYLLEAYANVTYTLPGSFTEDPCRYSVVSANVNVPSAWFNTSTYTFTPQKAGYWEITAAYDVYRNGEASMAIKKNNSIVAAAGSFNAVAQQVTKIIYFNGSTDSANIINVGGAALQRDQYDGRSWFQARWVGT